MVEVTITVPTHETLAEVTTVEIDDEVAEDDPRPELNSDGQITAILEGSPTSPGGTVKMLVIDSGGPESFVADPKSKFVRYIEGQFLEDTLEAIKTAESKNREQNKTR
jgi:hypothetical protein